MFDRYCAKGNCIIVSEDETSFLLSCGNEFGPESMADEHYLHR